jgi:type II secretory ATPase GspE/PulE/Tfp pilus assembly ATPase PilB-like protein
MVTTEALEQVLKSGAVWLVLVAGWVAACLWVDRDARVGLPKAAGWKAFFVALGLVFFLATWQFGLKSLVVMLALEPLALVAYAVFRELVAPDELKLLSQISGGRLSTLAGRLGLGDALERIKTSWRAPEPSVSDPVVIALLKKNGQPYDSKDASGLDQETSRAIRSVQGILLTAIRMRATDVHLEPKVGGELQIRYRIDGILQTISTLPADAGRAIVSAAKVLADMDIAERRRPQDGTFATLYDGRKFDIRAASGPTNFGEKMSLRLLDADGGIVKEGLNGIGMRESMLKTLRTVIHRPDGMLIVCGPTGSGKTTTLYAAINEIDVLSRNILTIEDPIEYRLENISQTAVNNAADLTFAKILRSVLRQDPDVILVGEIRDKETAEIAMEAAVTGHFVFTTVHANDAATTITRLLDMGIEATRMQAAVTAVLAQRLVRVLCDQCKEPYKPSPADLKRYGIPADKVNVFYREKGCTACNGTGYRGRTGIHELMVFDNKIRELLVGRPSMETIRTAARRNGTRTLAESCLYKVVAGVTSVNECARVSK